MDYIGKRVQGYCEGKTITGEIVSFYGICFYDKKDKGTVKIHMDKGGYVVNDVAKLLFL